jgi:plastocyanin
MRARLCAPLATLALLALPAAAPAATSAVSVGDDFFSPSTVQIAPGDTVQWNWSGSNQHNVRADPNQTESFRSPFMTGSGSFSHTFPSRGRFTYFCEVHPTTMRGAVEVGSEPFPDTVLPRLAGLRARPSRRSVRFTFRLSERARVRASVSGPSRKVMARSLAAGRRSLTIRRLRRGRYRASLRVRDTAGNRGRTARTRFRIR